MICKDCRTANRFDSKSKYDMKSFYSACEFLDLIDETVIKSYEDFLQYAEDHIARLHNKCRENTHPTYCDCQHKLIKLTSVVRDFG